MLTVLIKYFFIFRSLFRPFSPLKYRRISFDISNLQTYIRKTAFTCFQHLVIFQLSYYSANGKSFACARHTEFLIQRRISFLECRLIKSIAGHIRISDGVDTSYKFFLTPPPSPMRSLIGFLRPSISSSRSFFCISSSLILCAASVICSIVILYNSSFRSFYLYYNSRIEKSQLLCTS